MGTTTVRRQGRLYVSRGGRTVGWYDLSSGDVRSAPGHEQAVRGAVDDWVRRESPLRRRPLPTTLRAAGDPTAAAVRVPAPRAASEPLVEAAPSLRLNEPGGPAAHRARVLLDRAPQPRRLLGRSRPPREALPWLQAAHGQRLVGDALAGLGPTWQVLHAAPLGGGAVVDHVLVGPGGVLAVTTRSHAVPTAWLDGDRLRVGGQPKTYVRDSRRRAAAVAAVVSGTLAASVPVQPVLVLVGPRAVDVRRPAAGVAVLPGGGLLEWLRARPAVLASTDVARLAGVLEDARRWPGHEDPVRSAVA
ncbi:NERD domain-containing protein [Aquipuribacter sp. SD81]|uniref:NERD domain-containing protein n=1 Tax=Aquipuribacter sp. SD81 TaxID=3127703 RepID=UPI0030195CF3